MKKILIMGLPGSGKTTLAMALKRFIESQTHQITRNMYTATWFNADEVRKLYDDWDFSKEGRIRQSTRMKLLASMEATDYVIADFVAPLPKMRQIFSADWTVWVDTIESGRYPDTNAAFVPPKKCDFKVTEQNAVKWAQIIGSHILANHTYHDRFSVV
jgi:adenylylsulfate kinase